MDILPPQGGRGDVTLEHDGVHQLYCVHPDGLFLQLSSAQNRLWLALLSGEIGTGPFLPRFRIEHMPWLEPQMLSLRRINGLFRSAQLGRHTGPDDARAARLIVLLRAYDAQADGASHREFALQIFGFEAVNAQWNGASDFMRTRVKRMMRVSRQLVAGGYRNLIA